MGHYLMDGSKIDCMDINLLERLDVFCSFCHFKWFTVCSLLIMLLLFHACRLASGGLKWQK